MKNLVLVISLLFLVGCGGSSGGSFVASADNSKNTDKQNSYGYYGASVIFGEHVLNGNWDVTYQGTEHNWFFSKNGTVFFSEAGKFGESGGSQSYGVSKDGGKLFFDNGSFTIKSKSGNCYTLKGNEGSDSVNNVKMCVQSDF